MTDVVLRRDQGRVTEVVLNRPNAGNAFDFDLVRALHETLDGIDSDSCEIIVFRGEGKGFCGGLDLSKIHEETDDSLLGRLVQIELLLQKIASMPQLTVAMAHRFAYGAGADLFVACRYRIASPGTRFAFPGVRFGIALGTGRLSRCVGPDAARQLLATTSPIDSKGASKCGLVQRQAEVATWEAMVRNLCETRSSFDARMAGIVTNILSAREDDRDLATLVRSAALPGLKQRIANYVMEMTASPKG